jgi:hypothetical protein
MTQLSQPAWTSNFISEHDLIGELFESLHIYIGNIREDLEKIEDSIDDLELMRQFLPEDRLKAIEAALKALTEKLTSTSKPTKHKKRLTNTK